MRTPSDVLCKRLDELSKAVTQGREAVGREFTMRVPAEPDRDADLVLSSAAERIRELKSISADLIAIVDRFVEIADKAPPVEILHCLGDLVEPARAARAKARGEGAKS